MPDIYSLISEALQKPKDAVYYHVSSCLKTALPDMALVETDDHYFKIDEFRDEGQCSFKPKAHIHNEWSEDYDAGADFVHRSPYTTWLEVEWQGHHLEVISVGLQGQFCREMRHFILAPSEAIGVAFFQAVCRWISEVRGEVLVFQEGHWHKSKELFEAIQNSTLDSLVLPGPMLPTIVQDFKQFFQSEETYRRYRLPWKRGVLFLGPPGNGKTHMVKGLINTLGLPCLYVRSFHSEYGTDHLNISKAFARARDAAPCIFVLEDLDSLITGDNRSYFLNEMDGFYSNRGILTIGTTNYPEKLDPAIMDRPSRFDRKYEFGLPGVEERKRYLELQNEGLEVELKLSSDGVQSLAEATDEFSFAYLKELVLSSMMAWIRDEGKRKMDDVMLEQVEALAAQMKTAAPLMEEFSADAEDMMSFLPPQMRRMAARFTRGR